MEQDLVTLGHCRTCTAQVIWSEEAADWIHIFDQSDGHRAEPVRVPRGTVPTFTISPRE